MATKKTKPKPASTLDIARTEDEIDDVMNTCSEVIDSGDSHFEGMSYEQGVQAALDWVLGRTEDHPFPEEE